MTIENTNSIVLPLLFVLATINHVYRITVINRKPRWGDAHTYLRLAREIASKRRVPKRLDYCISAGGKGDSFTLPPLLMVLMAPFSRLSYTWLINFPFLFDILTAVAIFFSVNLLLGGSSAQSFFASIVYLLTPINSGNGTALTPRPLGLFCFLCFVVFSYLYLERGYAVFFLIASLSVMLLLLSQRMVTQITLILTPIVALMWYVHYGVLPVSLLLAVAVGIVLAIVATRGWYLTIIGDHYKRLRLHAKFGDQSNFKKKLGNPLLSIKCNPWILLLPFLLFSTSPIDKFQMLILYYLVGIVALSIFWVLGNSHNHMYFAAPFVAILLAGPALKSVAFNICAIICGIVIFIIIIREYRSAKNSYISDDWISLFEYINDRNLYGKVCVLPRVSCPPMFYYTGLSVISAGHGSEAMNFNRIYMKSCMKDILSFKDFLRVYAPRFIVVENTSGAESFWDSYLTSCTEKPAKLYANGSLALYEARM